MPPAAAFMTPVDDNLPWDQRLANYAADPTKGKSEYQRALQKKRYQLSAGDTAGADASQAWMGQVDTAAGGAASKPVIQTSAGYRDALQLVRDRIAQPAKEFQYDPNTDPAFQAQKTMVAQDTARDQNNARVEAGASGMRGGSLQNNQLSQISAINQGRLQNQILPATHAQAYQQYRDGLAQDQQQTGNMLAVAGAYNQADQQDFNNQHQDASLEEQRKARRIALAQHLTSITGQLVNPTEDASQSYAQVEGVPTLAYQQYLQGVKAQDAGFTGMYGDQPTMQKDSQNFSQEQQKAQLAISRMNAGTSAASSLGNLSLNQSKYKDAQTAKQFQGNVMAELGQLSNEADINAWLNMNAKEIASNLGVEGYQQLKDMALAPFQGQKIAQDKQSNQQQAVRQKAITFAQSDPNWKYASPQEQKDLINFYMGQVQ